MNDLITSITEFLLQNSWQVVGTLLVISTYLIVSRMTADRLSRSADEGGFKESSGARAARSARLIAASIGFFSLLLIWGVEFASVLVFAGTALTLLGVALFASWSILSNITAYFVLVLHPSFKRGNFIRVLEADNYAEGYIADLGFFSVRLITESRGVILYPNNLVLGRPCLINPRDRLSGVGKLPLDKPAEITE